MLRNKIKGLVLLLLTIGLGAFGFFGGSDVFAEDDGAASKVGSFDITVTETWTECEQSSSSFVGDYGYQFGDTDLECNDKSSDASVKVQQVKGKEYTVNPATVHGRVHFSILNGKLRVNVEDSAHVHLGRTTKTIDVKNSAQSFRNAVDSVLGPLVVESGAQPVAKNVKYTFKVGEVTMTEPQDAANSNGTTETGTGTGTGTGNGEVKQNCANSGGANSLGWVVCPILDLLGDASEDIYNRFLEPRLQVDPKLFTEGGDEGAMGGWNTFRNIADVLFIILFLIVIFSQLTGVGIDNYGIKKILPKLIVAAILINLSYWICLALVDLSNILGNSFQALFNSLGSSFGSPSLNIEGADSVGAISWTAVTGIAVLGALVGMTGTVWANPAIVLSLLVAALGVAISILFLFLLLEVREAAIVVLIVISPLAVICYILPNTKTVFDNWWKFFKGLLLVYPIVGLLVGGGNYVSKLLLGSGYGSHGFLEAFASMVVGIVPIFLIPTVLRHAFSALGNIGARIAGMGREASGWATNRARNSQAYRNAQERGLERQTRIRAGLDANGNERNIGRLGTFMRGGRRNMARNKEQYLGNLAAEQQRENILNGGFAAARAGIAARAEAEQVQNEEALIMRSDDRDNVGALQTGLEEAIASGNDSQIRAYQNVLSRKGDVGREAVRQAMVNAQDSGRVGNGAAQAYASNLMNNWANDYKDNNRSTYDYASSVLSGLAATLEQNAAVDLGSLKTSQIANMDDNEFRRLVEEHATQRDNDGNVTAVDDAFAELCHNTSLDVNATTGAKESRLSDIRRFAQGSQGYQQQLAQQQAVQQAHQQQQQIVQELQNINNQLGQHGNGGGNS